MKSSLNAKIASLVAISIALVLVLAPFHAFITVWLSSFIGHYNLLRIWKEILLTVVVPLVIYLVWRDSELWSMLKSSWLFWCSVAYVALHVVLGCIALLTHRVTAEALGYSLIVNLRLPAVLILAWIAATKTAWLRDTAAKIILWPAGIVLAFGLLQALLLPHDILRHAGYGSRTIAPYETVDQKLQYVRAQSTLRGPNPLGAYLVVVLTGIVAGIFVRPSRKRWLAGGIFALVAAAVLYLTYSRSAYIGAVVAVVVAGWLLIRSRRLKQWFLVATAALCLAGAGAALALRHNDRFENTFFHTDEHSQAVHSSNQDRASALQSGVQDVLHEPLGRGPGTAGPASEHNNHPARIAENYYLQIGQEVGWLGLGLFVAINILVGIELWRRRTDWLALTLFASLIGLSVVNLLSHAWTDDTLSYIWWGGAGIALAKTGRLTKKR